MPKTTRRGRRIVVRCGRLTTVELLAGMGLESATVARGSRVFRSRRRMTLRLSRDVSAIAEWCEFKTLPRGHSGAAVLEPPIAPRPAPLVSAPGVRVAITETGGARFLLDGSTLTLRTNAPLPGDVVVTLVCYATDGEEDLRILGGRTVAIGYRRRVVTVDLDHDVEAASDSCLAEDASGGGSDLHFAKFKP